MDENTNINDWMARTDVNENLWVDILVKVKDNHHIMGEMTVAAFDEAMHDAHNNDLIVVKFLNRRVVVTKRFVVAVAHRPIQEMIDEEARLTQERISQESQYKTQYEHKGVYHGSIGLMLNSYVPTPNRCWGSII
jgi:hypothetical protein